VGYFLIFRAFWPVFLVVVVILVKMNVVIVVVDVVFLVEFGVQPRQNQLLPNGAVKQPNQDDVLDDGPTQFGNDVARIGEDAPSFFPKGQSAVFHFYLTNRGEVLALR